MYITYRCDKYNSVLLTKIFIDNFWMIFSPLKFDKYTDEYKLKTKDHSTELIKKDSV